VLKLPFSFGAFYLNEFSQQINPKPYSRKMESIDTVLKLNGFFYANQMRKKKKRKRFKISLVVYASYSSPGSKLV
jgi:hypothetical protein